MRKIYFTLFAVLIAVNSCKKTPTIPEGSKPTADFTFNLESLGNLPDTVLFTSTSKNASLLKWDFGNGTTSTLANPKTVYIKEGVYNVRLIATNSYGSDSITKQVNVTINKPVADFSFATTSPEVLPITLSVTNSTIGNAVSFKWTFGDGDTSTQQNPLHRFAQGGIYTITLVATNTAGSDSVSKELRISPYLQQYIAFDNSSTTLYAWEGNHMMLLSSTAHLNRVTMFKWLKAVDTAYGYYKLSTGRDPILYAPNYYINNRATIADVENTCGAGCGFLGYTGIEMQNFYFDLMYRTIFDNDQYDQVVFYELGRNFWFYGDILAYKENDPATTGFAVFMRFMSMNAAGVQGAPYGSLSFTEYQNTVVALVDQYLANPSLNWANTLGAGLGVPGGFGDGSDLFASFCFRLRRDYGGENFVQNIWKKAALRPVASTTQDAVDNFFLASCAAANRNLTAVFQSWRWPLSVNAIAEASNYQ